MAKTSRFSYKMLYQGYDSKGRLVYEEMVNVHRHYDAMHKWDRDEFWKITKMRTLRFTRFNELGCVDDISENRRTNYTHKGQEIIKVFGD